MPTSSLSMRKLAMSFGMSSLPTTKQGYSFTLAPLAVKNLVILGISGGEYGIRGFIDAYDVDTGQRKWRFYTVPGPGEPGHDTWEGDSWKIGGAPAWNTGVYDAKTNQLFWPTGNPSPSNRGEGRAGDNLYSNSLLALDADTGKLNWYFQFTKHDEHDWDATQVPIMIDSGDKHLIAQANRNGFFYVLDRTTGKLLSANAYGEPLGATAKMRKAVLSRTIKARQRRRDERFAQGALGATNWMSPSFDSRTGLFYVTAREQCDIFSTAPQPYDVGHAYYGSAYFPSDKAEPYWGALRAIDPQAAGKVGVPASLAHLVGRAFDCWVGSCSPATRKGISSHWMRRRGSRSGTFRWAGQSTHPQWRSRSMENNTWLSPRAVHCTRLACRSFCPTFPQAAA